MYKFLYTERNNEKATEFETKSLLYLLSMREDSNEIDTFQLIVLMMLQEQTKIVINYGIYNQKVLNL